MATLKEQYGWVASRTIDATTTTLDFETNGSPFVLIEVLTSSSLSFKVGLVGKIGTNRTVRSFLLSGASTETQLDPDTATGTVAAQDFVLVPTLGAKRVRITRAAGSGTVQGVANPSDAVSSWLLMKLIDGGLAATISNPGQTETNKVLHNGTSYPVVRVGGSITASAAIVPQTSAKFGVLLDLLIFAKSGVTDTYRINDGTADLLGDSTAPVPLSSDGAAGAPGFRALFPFGLKTGAANRAINVTIGSGGDAAYSAVYILTDD